MEEGKMKKQIFTLIMGLLLIGAPAFAADGDFIVNGKVGIGTATPSNKLCVAGVIESTTGGIKFPDGTTQTTAATGGGSSSLPSLRAYLGANQAITGDIWSSMNINIEQEDIGNGLNTSTHIYTVPETGWYAIYARAVGSGCNYALPMRIILNGTRNISGTANNGGIGEGVVYLTTYLLQNDQISFQIAQANYGFTLLSGASNTYVQVRKLSN
jgi:hypothetical protein